MLAGVCALLQRLAAGERGAADATTRGFADRPSPALRTSTPARST
jgi:hypothetical protein